MIRDGERERQHRVLLLRRPDEPFLLGSRLPISSNHHRRSRSVHFRRCPILCSSFDCHRNLDELSADFPNWKGNRPIRSIDFDRDQVSGSVYTSVGWLTPNGGFQCGCLDDWAVLNRLSTLTLSLFSDNRSVGSVQVRERFHGEHSRSGMQIATGVETHQEVVDLLVFNKLVVLLRCSTFTIARTVGCHEVCAEFIPQPLQLSIIVSHQL